MATVTIELPPQQRQTEFNLRRWSELQADARLKQLDERIETNRFGHIIMSPPPSASHGSYQFRIGALLERYLTDGRVVTECPISTADGVKATDVAWASSKCLQLLGDKLCFPRAPEICVEVLSPGNSEGEMREKMALYFDAGAAEVWQCTQTGLMRFFSSEQSQPLPGSRLCPDFPAQVELGV